MFLHAQVRLRAARAHQLLGDQRTAAQLRSGLLRANSYDGAATATAAAAAAAAADAGGFGSYYISPAVRARAEAAALWAAPHRAEAEAGMGAVAAQQELLREAESVLLPRRRFRECAVALLPLLCPPPVQNKGAGGSDGDGDGGDSAPFCPCSPALLLNLAQCVIGLGRADSALRALGPLSRALQCEGMKDVTDYGAWLIRRARASHRRRRRCYCCLLSRCSRLMSVLTTSS
jgi:hypothetical protein